MSPYYIKQVPLCRLLSTETPKSQNYKKGEGVLSDILCNDLERRGPMSILLLMWLTHLKCFGLVLTLTDKEYKFCLVEEYKFFLWLTE